MVATDSIVSTVLTFLKDVIDNKYTVLKLRACELIGTILADLAEEAEIMEFLIEELIEKLCDRSK